MASGSTTGSADLLTSATQSEKSRSEQMDAFVRAQRPALVRFFRRRTESVEDAEEAAQESLIRLLRYQDSKPASAWRFLLYRIAANIATDRARRAKSHHATDHLPLDGLALTSSEPSQERVISGQQELALLRAAILELPPKCQQVFMLHRLQGLSYAQIAKRCGISVKMVEKHIHKALTLCLAKMDPGR